MAAFAAAVELGYRWLETDVHVTADGVLIAFHDDVLDHVTDRRGVVASLPWSEVRLARVGGVEPVVEFAELLRAFPAARFNVDPKHEPAVLPLVRAIHDARAVERVCVGSFSDRSLRIVRAALGPRGCTALGPRELVALRAAAWGARPIQAALERRFRQGAGRCVQVPVRRRGIPLAEPRLIATAHRLGLPVHVWTINDPVEMARLLDLGVDGLMTDAPGVLRAVLEARGQWHDPADLAPTRAHAGAPVRIAVGAE